MKEIVHSAAKATGLEIYGGDCIVDSKGGIFIIDLNDFPSFTAVRHEAAERIAQYIMNIKNKRKDDRR
jgi:glutathione synthase/RimK-type ligase-like ATP-grasp enzyme